jgi:hypothetical protein
MVRIVLLLIHVYHVQPFPLSSINAVGRNRLPGGCGVSLIFNGAFRRDRGGCGRPAAAATR